MTTRRMQVLAMLLLAVALLAGCGQQGPSDEAGAAPAKPAAEHAEAAPIEMTAALEAKLAEADRLDGEEDHVVGKCPGCNLAMDGTDAHAVNLGDYALHFCSEACKESFSQDLEASVMAMAVPEVTPAAEKEVQ